MSQKLYRESGFEPGCLIAEPALTTTYHIDRKKLY